MMWRPACAEPAADLDTRDDAFAFSRDGERCEVAGGYFILANIELPIQGESDTFVWTFWISLSEQSFVRMNEV
jgi:hypothetical protein